jgi:hypothetical protein
MEILAPDDLERLMGGIDSRVYAQLPSALGKGGGAIAQCAEGVLASLAPMGEYPDRGEEGVSPIVLQILEMELTLTWVAGGTIDRDRISAIFTELLRLAVTDPHRRLPLLTLWPLLEENVELREEFEVCCRQSSRGRSLRMRLRRL